NMLIFPLTLLRAVFLIFFSFSLRHQNQHSFPTRRSSDLEVVIPTKTLLTPSRAIPTRAKGHDGNERQRHNLKGFFTMSTATAKVVSAPNPDLKDFDPTQPTTFVAMIVENDRNRGSLTITAETEAQDATVSFKINSMRYDEKATGDIKFVPDKDKAAEAEAICQEAFGL